MLPGVNLIIPWVSKQEASPLLRQARDKKKCEMPGVPLTTFPNLETTMMIIFPEKLPKLPEVLTPNESKSIIGNE